MNDAVKPLSGMYAAGIDQRGKLVEEIGRMKAELPAKQEQLTDLDRKQQKTRALLLELEGGADAVAKIESTSAKPAKGTPQADVPTSEGMARKLPVAEAMPTLQKVGLDSPDPGKSAKR